MKGEDLAQIKKGEDSEAGQEAEVEEAEAGEAEEAEEVDKIRQGQSHDQAKEVIAIAALEWQFGHAKSVAASQGVPSQSK